MKNTTAITDTLHYEVSTLAPSASGPVPTGWETARLVRRFRDLDRAKRYAAKRKYVLVVERGADGVGRLIEGD